MKDKPDKNGSDIKPGDNEDSESSEEQPLDIGEHYLVQRRNETWRKLENKRANHYCTWLRHSG